MWGHICQIQDHRKNGIYAPLFQCICFTAQSYCCAGPAQQLLCQCQALQCQCLWHCMSKQLQQESLDCPVGALFYQDLQPPQQVRAALCGAGVAGVSGKAGRGRFRPWTGARTAEEASTKSYFPFCLESLTRDYFDLYQQFCRRRSEQTHWADWGLTWSKERNVPKETRPAQFQHWIRCIC